MIPKECKRLAEVDFPIAVVSKHAVREKSIRHGHPSTLHLWWARRPLAACRAMLLGLLLPDPCDEYCPEDFKARARDLLPRLLGTTGPNNEDLRKSLLRFIGDFANWDNSNHTVFLEVGRELVKAAHGEEPPLVVDPFAGGGSIPLEALRLGCDAFASDINPVACLILRVLIDDIPRHGPVLVRELRRINAEIKRQAKKELADFYPKDRDGGIPIAYIWARTVKCESPKCGAEIPLMRSFWLSKKTKRKQALLPKIIRPSGRPPRIDFEIFNPTSDSDVRSGTVTRAKATCPCCSTVLSPERVRAQLSEQRGGADVVFDEKGMRVGGARMLAVVALRPEEQGRHFRLSIEDDYVPIWKAHQLAGEAVRIMHEDIPSFPNEGTPWQGGHRSVVSLRVYGMGEWGDLFTTRQKIGITAIIRLMKNLKGITQSTRDVAGLAVSRLSDICNALCMWESSKTQVRHLFTRHDLPVMWDFAEPNLLAEQAGDYSTTLNTMIRVIERLQAVGKVGQVDRADARYSPLPDNCVGAWFTDPPYYDAVAYADLSDFFYVWLKRVLPRHPLLTGETEGAHGLTPKRGELTVTTREAPMAPRKSRALFETGMGHVFAEGSRILREDGVGTVVFAHKTTEGWEALLTGMIRGGLTITASWPLATELQNRMNARETASLATSVHLVCRPRPMNAPTGDWADVLRELPSRVVDWMERLQGEGVRGADLVFACIGPALEIFSRYSKVETADGREVKLDEYLVKVWEVVGRSALEQVLGTAEAQTRNGAAGALEEDARLTALFLWTLQSTNGQNGSGKEPDKGSANVDVDDDDEEAMPKGKPKGYSLVFDVVRRFAQPLGIDLPKWEGRVIETKKGVVRLMAVSERAKQLFGDDGADAVADWIEQEPRGSYQMLLFPEAEKERVPKILGRKSGRVMSDLPAEAASQAGVTTLDRVHAAMLLQAGGQANALRVLIKSEQERGPDFLRLANALSALYPTGSEEKRLLDAMLLAVPR